MKKIFHDYKILFIILIIASFLRFYNFPTRISFDRDASLDALVSRYGSTSLQFPLVGPFSSAAPITTGPWYYYQMIITGIILPTPYAPWISFALTSILMVFAMYKIGTILIGKRFGLLLAAIASISPVQVSLSTGLGNASVLGQFGAIAIWLFLETAVNKKPLFYLWLLGFLVGVCINFHFQAILLIPLFIAVFLIQKQLVKSFMVLFSGFLISFLPLLAFDANNHWYNLTHTFEFIVLGKNAAIEIKRWLTYIFDFHNSLSASVLGLPQPFAILTLLGGMSANLILLYRQKIKLYVLVVFVFQFIFLRYYRGPLRENYVQFLHPFIFLFYGSLIYLISQKVNDLFFKTDKYSNLFLALTAGIFFMFGLPKTLSHLRPNSETVKLYNHVETLTRGQKTIVIFRCKRSNNTMPWAVSLRLSMQKKLYENTQKPLPALQYGYSDNIGCVEKFNHLNSEMVSLQYKNIEEAKKDNWEIVTPKIVYEQMTKWWYEEKP